MSSTDISQFTPYITLSITIIFIIYGWSVIYRNSRKLASRSETYKILSDISDLISTIEVKSHKIWGTYKDMSKEDAYLFSTTISSHVSLLINYMNIIEGRNIVVPIDEVIKLKRAATLDSENTDRVNVLARANKINHINAHACNIRSSLYGSYIIKYPLE